MRFISSTLCLLALAPVAVGCSAPPERGPDAAAPPAGDASADPVADEAAARAELVATAGGACPPSNQACVVTNLRRTPLRDGIVEYSLELKVGPGEFDRIGLHRVARERAPFRPVAAKAGVFMVHGDAWPFNPLFVGGRPKAPAARAVSAALHFAERGIDVWGIDRRWVQSPADATDLSFMQDWTFGAQVKDIGVGLGVARALRALTGSGAGPMHLLGFSRGAALTYAYADAETQLPPALRQIKGIVPVDYAYKYDPADPDGLGALSCQNHADYLGFFNDGFVGYSNEFFAQLGALAESDPSGESPFDPALTNANFAVSLLSLEAPTSTAYSTFFHGFGGRRVAGSDFELLYTDEGEFTDYLQSVAPVEALREEVDGFAIGCDAIDTPYDDHLGQITVPALYVAAAGGFGEPGLYTLGLLGSADKSSLVVRQRPAGDEVYDYGHQDLFTGRDAPELVFEPIADWLLAH